MKYIGSVVAILLLISIYSFTTKTINPVEQDIKEKVLKFAEAIEWQNVEKLDNLLHQNFRVVANQYPKADVTTILDKATYLKLITAKKIGGKAYKVNFKSIIVEQHNATVVAKFEGGESTMSLTLLLVKSNAGKWEIISDMAIIK